MQQKLKAEKRKFAAGWQAKSWLHAFFGGIVFSLPMLCGLSCIALLVVSACIHAYLAGELLSIETSASQTSPTATPAAIAELRATLVALSTEISILASATPSSPATMPPPIALSSSVLLPVATPPPDYLAAYTIQSLRARAYPGGALHVRSVLTETQVFTRYYVDYPSDGLTITGIMQVPPGKGPFPVIILNHGYVPRDRYWSGADTWNAAEYLNRRGYLTIAPDFRSWGESDVGSSFFSSGQVIDVLNLISSLPSLPEADAHRVGMWGHSMGGGVTTKVITIDSHIKAAVLYAPVSADDGEVLARWGMGCKAGQPEELAGECAGAEVLTDDVSEDMLLAYQTAAADPGFVYQISPVNYLDWVGAPVQIHVGTADTTTPLGWSVTIYQGLREAGKEVEYFVYPGQGHALEGEYWRLFMERVADFFDRHVANGP